MISTREKYEIYKPKKFLGQNFLIDKNIAKKIVTSLEIKKDDLVIEIGPGQGILTEFISELTENLFAVEIDRSIFEKLKTKFGEKINLIHKDFLKIDFAEDINPDSQKIKIIGNIPYNITTEILFKLFESNDTVSIAILMMQKEVAHRLTAKPNSKDYGILAIHTQLNSTPKILFNVPPAAFFPKPNVNSAVVRFEFKLRNETLKNKNLFKEIVRESFGQRRKTMRNSLKKFLERNIITCSEIDFDFTRRPENVSIEEFICLTNCIYDLKKVSI